jgi:histidyl-tRNA synthetase
MKSQFKRADASGAAWALIFGPEELARGEVALKALRDPSRPQALLALSDVSSWATRLLGR